MFLRLKKINQTGDTIVEVLIAIAVVSSILAGAYTISNLSLKNVRQSQDRSVGLKFAEGQAEQLKQLASKGGFDDSSPAIRIFDSNNFCTIILSGELLIRPDTDPLCSPSDNGGINYSISVSRTNPVGDSHQFNIIVRWDNVNGTTDQTTIVYNLTE